MTQQEIVAIITKNANTWKVNPKLAIAIAIHESSLNPNAIAGAGTPDEMRGGSYGLMQVSLQTAKGLGFKGVPSELLDPSKNTFYGCMLLHQLGKRKNYTMADIICAYNSGKPEATAPASTLKSYLPAVMNLYGSQQAVAPAAPPADNAQ